MSGSQNYTERCALYEGVTGRAGGGGRVRKAWTNVVPLYRYQPVLMIGVEIAGSIYAG